MNSKKLITVLLGSLLLLCFLTVPVTSFALLPGSTVTSLSQTQFQEHREEKGHNHWNQRERHPEIHSAIRELHKAQKYLQKASHDFGGHRTRALQLIEQAEQELKAALQYDRH